MSEKNRPLTHINTRIGNMLLKKQYKNLDFSFGNLIFKQDELKSRRLLTEN